MSIEPTDRELLYWLNADPAAFETPATEAWFSALPTDPTALRAQLLSGPRRPAIAVTWTSPGAASGAASTCSPDPGSDCQATPVPDISAWGSETDVTYEDPGTGAVLAQVWKETGGDVITAVYQPVQSTDALPPNPYPS